MFRSYTFTFDEVRPDEKVLMDYLQIPDNDSYPLVAGIVESTFAALKDTREIIGGYRILDYGDVTLQPGRRISGYMAGASEVALFICTAGAAFTDLSQAYQQNGDFLEAFVVESIGSATVENAMDKVQQRLEEEMAGQGKKITNRYSPGYCEWPLSGQRELFAYIGDHPTGITLNESCLMQPIKSVSGIIGIGDAVKKRPYGCQICNSATCVYRKIKRKTH
ncbi:vitamin B12 dependent-methionine synthase activation domain-containing protein [uncultured Parabacteroides sp.]|jgi:hypothetical protein|uniref:vitamin B12 dependent-methionine synthase activation domain-containing protein n=1 Tax=uncultured Parabacteroides sp. TaxID=512312 RepID=UPI0025E4963D|nr:vitamin B12 dependent-methionine synthase activation domain-containing protein [uncultured Parabacteroides sp.]